MTVKPVLGDWEIPRVQRMQAIDRRAFVELPIPGRTGSLFQDLDAAPTGVAIAGSLFGEEARNEFLEEVRGQFSAGEPVTFVADILTATEVQYVIIERMQFLQSGLRPDEIEFWIELRESPPPPPPPDPFGGLDTSLLDQAGDFLDSVSSALDLIDSLGSVPDISDPTDGIVDAVDSVSTATAGLADALSPLLDIFGSDDE